MTSIPTKLDTIRLLAIVYRCRSHINCGARFKIKTAAEPEAPTQYYLERTGGHGSQPATVTRRGIHPQLLDEVDALLNMGWGAKQLRSMLNHRYHDEPRSLRMVPSCKQLENRKAFLVRCSANGWDISNHVAFTAWSSQKVCDTREKFMAVDDPNDRRMDEMIVLDTFIFDGQAPDEGTSFGAVVATRRVFRNVPRPVRD